MGDALQPIQKGGGNGILIISPPFPVTSKCVTILFTRRNSAKGRQFARRVKKQKFAEFRIVDGCVQIGSLDFGWQFHCNDRVVERPRRGHGRIDNSSLRIDKHEVRLDPSFVKHGDQQGSFIFAVSVAIGKCVARQGATAILRCRC